jgi:hypothetical protein
MPSEYHPGIIVFRADQDVFDALKALLQFRTNTVQVEKYILRSLSELDYWRIMKIVDRLCQRKW